MYTLIRQSSVRTLLITQAPALTGALVIAELFYKWGSFLLECFGFLATWALIDLALSALDARFGRR